MEQAERDERVMSLVAEALETPLRERDSFLQARCQNDPNLYHEVSQIVAWEERMGSFLRRPLIEFIDLEALEQIFEPGQTVAGRFEIIRRVGDGGMGIVYEAFDIKRGERIAIKCAKPGFDRLLSPELKRARDVRHQNICLVNEIHTTKTEQGELDFLTMEFLDGETLAHKLEGGRLENPEAELITRQLCAGLVEAHGRGILHRDLKPGNVILCRDKNESPRAVITDFGLATESTEVSDLEGGTPSYMAPELWRGGKSSQASDVFSLGVILYEMVTGCKPFPALNTQNIAFPPPVAPSKLVKDLPRRWDAAILPCLKEDPSQRCSAQDVLTVLNRKPVLSRPETWIAIAACIVILALISPKILDWLKPPPNRLVILPANTTGDLAQRAEALLTDTAQRIRQIQSGKATVSVIPLDKALAKGVTTPEQAVKILHATHALQVTLQPDAGGVSVEGKIVDLAAGTQIQGYSARFSQANLSDVPNGLAETVSYALHLHRVPKSESVSSAAEAHYAKGRDYQVHNDFAHAIPELLAASELDPHSPLPVARLAEAKAREYRSRGGQGFGPEAQAWISKAEALDADSPTVLMTSGLLHLMADKPGEYYKALADYQRVKEIDPGNVEPFLRSGYAYDKLGRPNDARSDYQHARLLAPSDYKPLESLGKVDFEQGDYSGAVEMYDQAMKLKPGNIDLYGSLAGAYIAMGKDKEADQVLKSIPGGGSTEITLNNAGAELAFQGRDAEAVQSYLRAIQLKPDDLIVWLNLGDAQRRLQQGAEAIKSYKTGLDLAEKQLGVHPGDSTKRAYFAYLQARLGKTLRARSEMAQALGDTKDDEVMLCAVHTYEVLGDREEAINWAGKVSSQTLNNLIFRHPDLAGFRQDDRFKLLLAQSK